MPQPMGARNRMLESNTTSKAVFSAECAGDKDNYETYFHRLQRLMSTEEGGGVGSARQLKN